MAIKSTIYKAQLQVSDLDRSHFSEYNLTLPCHPSETAERLMLRLLVFALHSGERLEFANAISNQEEPDLWQKDYSGDIQLWIQVGQPDEKTIQKAANRSREVVIYCYNQQPLQWWTKIAPKLQRFRNLSVHLVPADFLRSLAALADRSMDLQVTIQDSEIYVHSGEESLQTRLQKLC